MTSRRFANNVGAKLAYSTFPVPLMYHFAAVFLHVSGLRSFMILTKNIMESFHVRKTSWRGNVLLGNVPSGKWPISETFCWENILTTLIHTVAYLNTEEKLHVSIMKKVYRPHDCQTSNKSSNIMLSPSPLLSSQKTSVRKKVSKKV